MSKKHHQEEHLKELQDCKNELQEYKNKYLHLLADQENTRKRIQKEKEEMVRFSAEKAVAEFLPLIDSFENALKFSEKASPEIQTWAIGFKMMLSQFCDVLHNFGIVAYHSEGNLFDPLYHEAVETLETEEHQNGLILEEFAKGYKSQNRTIRPARVKVARKPAPIIAPAQEISKEEPSLQEQPSPTETLASQDELLPEAETLLARENSKETPLDELLEEKNIN